MPHRKPEIIRDEDHEEIKELTKWKNAIQARDEAWGKVCKVGVSCASLFFCGCFWLGNKTYENLAAVKAGIKAFWAAVGNNHD